MTPCASLGLLGKKRKMAQCAGGLDAATDGFHVVLCSYSTRCAGLCLVLERRLVSVRIHTRLARRAELDCVCSVPQDPLKADGSQRPVVADRCANERQLRCCLTRMTASIR